MGPTIIIIIIIIRVKVIVVITKGRVSVGRKGYIVV